jgi:hypothetical protein
MLEGNAQIIVYYTPPSITSGIHALEYFLLASNLELEYFIVVKSKSDVTWPSSLPWMSSEITFYRIAHGSYIYSFLEIYIEIEHTYHSHVPVFPSLAVQISFQRLLSIDNKSKDV